MLDWERLKSIQFDYNILEKDLLIAKNRNKIDDDSYEDLIKLFNSSQSNFVKGTREQLLTEELIRANNWCDFISGSVQKLASSTNGILFEFDHRLKTRDSLDEKYQKAKLAENNEDSRDGLNNILALQKALAKIHDHVRYTVQYKFKDYVNKYFEAQRFLKSNGFKTVKVKNTWVKDNSYKGVNTIVEAYNPEKDRRYLFEIQFYNEISVDAKNKTHKLYKIFSNENRYTKEERAKANDERMNIFNSLPMPDRIEEIEDFNFLE